MVVISYQDARAALPSDAIWSASFGYPGNEWGYSEYWRCDGASYRIERKAFSDVWHVTKEA